MGLILFILGLAAGILPHEAGHAIAGYALGFSIRLIEVGIGPILVRISLGPATLLLRLLPIAGRVRFLPPLQPRRAAHALLFASGALANFTMFTLLAASAAALPTVADELAPIAFAQLALAVCSLIPSTTKSGFQSDGRRLLSLLRGNRVLPAARAHDVVFRLIWNGIGPVPPPSAAMPELIYQVVRADRYGEPWARRDAANALQHLLKHPALSDQERTLTLDLLVSLELFWGNTGIATSRLDAWSQEALRLSPSPGLQINRAGVLVRLGQPEAARTMLCAQLDCPLAPHHAVLCRALVAQALSALGDEPGARLWADEARALIPAERKTTLLPILANLRATSPAPH